MVIIKYEHFSNKSKTLLLESDSLLLSNASSSKISAIFPTYSKIIDSTDLGSLIGNTQCGNFRIFLLVRFLREIRFGHYEPLKIAILTI